MIIELVITCPFCGTKTSVYVYEEDLKSYENGAHAQDCFDYLTLDEREVIISGLCFDCQKMAFAEL